MINIAFDSHKRYSLCSVEDANGKQLHEERIPHQRGAIQAYLQGLPVGSKVAVETIGNGFPLVSCVTNAI